MLWTFGVIGLAFLIGVVVVIVVVTSGDDGQPGGAGQSRKPDITKITEAMLLDQSSFPALLANTWLSSAGGSVPARPPTGEIDPSQCLPLVQPPSTRASITQGDLSDGSRLGVFMETTASRTDLHPLVKHCPTVTFDDGSTLNLKPVDVAGIPGWATVFETSRGTRPGDTNLQVCGIYRGVFIEAFYNNNAHDTDRRSDLARLFNAQVAKLRAAP